MNMKKAFHTRVFRNGAYSLLVTAAVIAIAILIQFLLAQLPASVIKPSISPYDYYSLTETTETLVKGLKDKITIHLVASTGAEEEILVEFINRYRDLNSNLSLKLVDPTASPGFITEHASEDLSENSLIVINDRTGASRVINYSEIFYPTFTSQEEYLSYLMYGVGGVMNFAGENELTSALDYVTMENHPAIYQTSGHGESALSQSLTKLMDDDNYTVNTLSLLTITEIPADAAIILINIPSKDFVESEIALLRSYMEKGGKVLLNSYHQNGDLPLLYGLMAEYGMSFKPGMVLEGNVNQYMNAPYFIMPNITDTPIVDRMESSNVSLFMPMAHAIGDTDQITAETHTKTVLLNTSNAAFIKIPDEEGNIDFQKNEEDEAGIFTLAAMVTNMQGGGAVWFASPFFMDEQFLAYNMEYIMATLGHLTGKESSISIATKTMSDSMIVVSAGAQTFWAVLLIGIIPLGCLGLGLVVWNKRRKQ